jgi:hypothetical protein
MSTRALRRLPVIAALLGLATLSRAAQGPASPSIRLFDLTTARAIVDEKPSEATRIFRPDDEVIYLWYAAEGCTAGTTIRTIWFYLETDAPLRFADNAVTVDRSGAWGQFNFRLAPGTTWSIGRYRIELRIGDEVVAATDFRVIALSMLRTVSFTRGAPNGRASITSRIGFGRGSDGTRRS